MFQILNEDGTVKDQENVPKIPAKELVKWLELMIALRTLDQKGMRLQRQGRIGFHIPTTGQEAHVAAAAALKKNDWIFPAYREHACALYRGYSLKTLVHHLFANDMDPEKGRRLPGLFGSKEHNFVNPSAPIGTQIIQASGAAYGAKYLKDGNVVIVFFGDGATSSNDFHSGMNFGGVFKVPAIYYCQNNQWAISVPLRRQTAAKRLADKALGYGMPGIQIDGNDVFAVYSQVTQAAERARKGEGPTFIEAVTYRLGPHTSSDDPSRYRSEEEVKIWRNKEPIRRLKLYLINSGIITEKEENALWERYDKEITQYIKEAEKRPPPPLDSMFDDVYEEMPWHLKEQLNEVKRFFG